MQSLAKETPSNRSLGVFGGFLPARSWPSEDPDGHASEGNKSSPHLQNYRISGGTLTTVMIAMKPAQDVSQQAKVPVQGGTGKARRTWQARHCLSWTNSLQ